tara:strand:+ start:1214 stop:1723 length:510 start_codon:yes stop_codon:yes gene_type:complete
MIKNSDYERVYTGSEINVNYLKNLLEEKDIHGVVRNDFQSGLRGGFGGGIPDHVQLFVKKENIVKAKRIIDKGFSEDDSSEEEFAEHAEQSRLAKEEPVNKKADRPLIKKGPNKKRSVVNLMLNLGLIIYSAWRLFPLLHGETLPAWRIALSAFILIFCLVAVIRYFKN